MLTNRGQMYREACKLIAADRRGTPRDDGYHHWRVQQFDCFAQDVLASFKQINRVLDAHLKG